MKKAAIIVCTLLCLWYDVSHAQQDAQYTQYMFNNLVLNPAYAGSRETVSATAIYRHQWAGVDGAPRTISLSGHSPLGERVGVGLFLENDKLGVHNRFSLFASYAYHLPLGDAGKLSMGLQAGFLNYSSNWNDLPSIAQPGDPNFQGRDSRFLPNFGLGLYYYTKRYYVGFSIPHLLNGKLNSVGAVSHQYRHYFLSGGAVFDIAENIKLKPSLLIKSVPGVAPLIADINLSALFYDAFWAGIGYRTGDALMFLLEYQFQNGIRVGYAYDLTTSKLNSSGTHELMLGWDLVLNRKRSPSGVIVSPRFF